ncbi:MAG: hypothetical protein DCC57_03145 [Chloroflexi bacterium]|nr:MAG: hypothetical protein DCC57_03145 [Chloroflexota bacterium]
MIRTQQLDAHPLIEIARRHQLAYLALFGSYARGQATSNSDVDLYARFGRPVALFEVLTLKYEMEDALGLAVDLIVEEAVVPYAFVRDGIERDQVILYEQKRPTNVVAK